MLRALEGQEPCFLYTLRHNGVLSRADIEQWRATRVERASRVYTRDGRTKLGKKKDPQWWRLSPTLVSVSFSLSPCLGFRSRFARIQLVRVYTILRSMVMQLDLEGCSSAATALLSRHTSQVLGKPTVIKTSRTLLSTKTLLSTENTLRHFVLFQLAKQHCKGK